jgi:hypothetical protein
MIPAPQLCHKSKCTQDGFIIAQGREVIHPADSPTLE